MKRLFSAILLCMLLLPAPSAAEGEGALSLVPGTPNGSVYPVSVRITAGTGAEMMQFCIGFDSEKLDLVSFAAGDALTGLPAPTLSNARKGRVYFVWDALTPFTAGGTLLVLTLRRKADAAGDAAVFFDPDEEFIFADGAYQPIAMETDSCYLTWDESPEAAAVSDPAAAVPVAIVTEGGNHGVTLSENKLSLKRSGKTTLTAPETAGAVIWSSSNEQVATVENGVVTAVSDGVAIVTAETEDGQGYATCLVTVGEGTFVATGVADIFVETAPVEPGSSALAAKATPAWLWIACGAGIALLAAAAGWLLWRRKQRPLPDADAPQPTE